MENRTDLKSKSSAFFWSDLCCPPLLSELRWCLSGLDDNKGGRKRNRKKSTNLIDWEKRWGKRLSSLKTIFSHLGLYLGLVVYTALGAWVFILFEHPVEVEKLTHLQSKLIHERHKFLALVFNLTNKLDVATSIQSSTGIGGADPFSVLGMGSGGFEPSELASIFDNMIQVKAAASISDKMNFKPKWPDTPALFTLEAMLDEIDQALLTYELQVEEAAGSGGIDLRDKSCHFKWDYVQSVFFTSTIITTVGYGNISPVTLGGRIFCIVFAIIGIPFTLSVLADVGQITATLISVVWAKIKGMIQPVSDLYSRIKREYLKYQKRRRKTERRKKREERRLATMQARQQLEREFDVTQNYLDIPSTDGNGKRKTSNSQTIYSISSTCSGRPGGEVRDEDCESGIYTDFYDKELKRGNEGNDFKSNIEADDFDDDLTEMTEDESTRSETESKKEVDPLASIGITANILMASIAVVSYGLFLSVGSYVFTHYEDWTFFEAFYFCFITMTTIGFGDIVPNISGHESTYMLLCMVYILLGLAFTSTIIELVRRQYAESWRKVQELRAQIQAQLKLADHLRRMAEQGKDIDGMDVDLEELRANLYRLKKGRFGHFFDFDLHDLDWMDKRNMKAITIVFYETSV